MAKTIRPIERTSPAADTPSPPTGGTRTAVLGLTIMAVAPLLVVAADSAAAPFVLPITVLAGLGAFVAHRFGTWAKVVATVLGLLGVASVGSGPAAIGLWRPDSVFDFVPGWMLVIGAVLAVAGGATAVLAARRGRGPTLGPLRRVAVGLLAVLAVVSVSMSVAADNGIDPVAAEGAVVVELAEATFVPNAMTTTAGQPVRLVVRNTARVIHTFTIDAYGIDAELAPGQQQLVEFTPVAAGVIHAYCRPHSSPIDGGPAHDGMAGTITVVAAAGS